MSVEVSSIALFGGIACSLGPRDLPLRPGKPSMLFALLALEAGRVVRFSAVIDGLWVDDPPASARALVHTYISSLRRALDVAGAPRIATSPNGYRLDCDPQVVDVHRLLASAGSDDPRVWEAALAESASPLLGGLEAAFVEPWQVRVDAARELLHDRMWDRRIGDGRSAEVLPELRAAFEREPLREDRVMLLARALGQVGRVDDALRVLDGYRRRLGEELGLDPSPAVSALRQSLISSPSSEEVGLDTGSLAPRSLRSTAENRALRSHQLPRRRRGLLLAAGGTAAAIAATLVLVALQDGDEPITAAAVTGPALISVDPADGSLSAAIDLPVAPSQIEADADVVWVRSVESQAVAVLDLDTDDPADVTGLAEPPSALALDSGTAVVGLGFSAETVTIAEGQVGPPTPPVEGATGRLTLGGSDNGVWVATVTGDVHAPAHTAGWPAPVSTDALPHRLDVDGTRAWVITGARAELVALDSSDTPAVRSPLRGEAVDLTAGDDQAWAVTSGDDRLWHAAASGRVVATRVLPGTPSAVLFHGDTIWVAIASPPRLASYDPESLEPGVSVALPREPVDLAPLEDGLVVAVR